MKNVIAKTALLLAFTGFISSINTAQAEETFAQTAKGGVCYCSGAEQFYEHQVKNGQECFDLQKDEIACTLHIEDGKTYRFGVDAADMIELAEQNIDFASYF